MSSNIFQSPAILTSFSYTKDGGARLGFQTNELTDNEKLLIGTFYQKFGFVLFKGNKFDEDSIPKSDAKRSNKSHSVRLRASLYVLWEQKHKDKYLNFNDFYNSQMERFIEAVKENIQI